MTKGITLLPLLMTLSTWCAAQILAPNDILTTTPDSTNGKIAPRRMIASRDGGFLTAGLIEQQGYISRTSSCGDVIWTQQYLFGAETSLNSLAELPSGEIVAVGTCRNCAPGDTTQKALVIKTDVVGAVLLDTMLGRAGLNARANDVTITSDQKIALTGQVVIAAGFAPADAFLSVLNEQLQAETWKEQHQLFYDIGQALIQTNDGGFAIAGWSLASLASSRQAQVFRTDNAGNILWAYSAPHLSSEFHAIRQAPDGRIVALGDRQVDTIVGRDVYLAAFDDATGALLEEKTYGSPGSDSGNSLEVVDGGFLVGAYYGEPSQSGWNRRDWVFRLNEQFTLVDQYFRDGFLFAHDLVNAIPLSSDGTSFAYHSVVHFLTSFYELFFKRTFTGKLASLMQAPVNDQLVPRNLITNKGTVAFSGTLPATDTYDQMRLDVWRDNVLQQTVYDDSPQDFSFSMEIPAELANYTFRLSGQKGQQWYTEAEACHVVAGDAYLIQGQSNALAGLPFDPADTIDHAYRHYTNSFVRNYGLKFDSDTLYAWHRETGVRGDYADNLSGQWGLVLGNSIVENYGIPVAILNGAVGGIAIETMLPNPNNHGDTNRAYGQFLQRVQRSGLLGQLRAIFMFQGETNALPGAANSIDDYFQKFQTLDNAWKTDFSGLQQRYLFQIRPGWFNAGATLHSCLRIAEAQRRIAETIPNWQIMSTTGMNHDGLHYYYPNGYERAGNDIYRLVAHDLYDYPLVDNIHPPTVDSIRFSNCSRLEMTLTLRHNSDMYIWTPGWETDFWLEGDTAVTVTQGYVQGNAVVLSLSAAPGPGFTGLSYRSHPEGSDAPVKNASGTGMLTFYNFPVADYGLNVQAATTAASCFNAADGSASAFGTGGTPGYTFTWSNGFAGQMPNGLAAGAYTVTVTDAKSCTATASAVVAQPPALVLAAIAAPVSCKGDADGAISLLVSGGTPGYSYLWSNGYPGPNPDGLSAGIYTVTVTDTHACMTTVSSLVGEPSSLDLFANTAKVSCHGGSNGSINLTVIGGTPPYGFLWSTGYTGEDLANLSAGTYTVTVTDAHGCTTMAAATVSEPPALTLSAMVTPVSCYGDANGSIDVTVGGGVPGVYTFLWSSNWNPGGLSPGTYTITITDINGCTASLSATVTEPPALIDSLAVAACPGSSVLLPDGTTVTYPGFYPIHLISSNGCDSLILVTVDIPDLLMLSDTLIMPDNGTGNGVINVTVTGGVPPYSFIWSNGDLTPMADSLVAGTYSVTVADSRGCTQVFAFQVITVGTVSAGFPLPVMLYPNPCSDVLYLKTPGLAVDDAYLIRISDLAGREVMPTFVPAGELTRINMAQLPAGMYIVWAYGEGMLSWQGMISKI